MAKTKPKKAATPQGQRTIQDMWRILQQAPQGKKRKAEVEPTTQQTTRPTMQQPSRAPKRASGEVESSDSGESDSDREYVSDINDDDDDDDDDFGDDDFGGLSAEEIEEAERVQLLRTLESQDTLTVDQAMVLEPLETFEDNHALELSLENIQGTSLAMMYSVLY
jgi:hypothetical protein